LTGIESVSSEHWWNLENFYEKHPENGKQQQRVHSMTYQPSPQKALDRPQSPFLEQHAPHVGLQTKPLVPPQVPSGVTTPVCHGGTASVVVIWDATSAGSSQKRPIPFIANAVGMA
jgi:hypothetical protein